MENLLKEFIKDLFSNTEFIILILTGIGVMSLLFIKPVVDKFTQKFYPTSKVIHDIREIQLKEVYLPLYWKFRKYIGLSSKKLEIEQCRKLYVKAYIKANKYPAYMEEDIIDCIYELGRDIKMHDENFIRDKYKRTAVKLLKNINIQYLLLKKSLSYTTNTSFRSFRSLDKVDQFFRVGSILYFMAILGMILGMVLMQAAKSNYSVLLISFTILCLSGVTMIICVAIVLFNLLKIMFRRIIRFVN